MIREPIYQALFAKLSASASFNTSSRRFKLFADVAPVDQPALFLIQRGESIHTTPGMPPVSIMSCDVALYVNTRGDNSVAPATVLNPLIDAVLAALAADPVSNKQTLGGLVQHAWVEGEIQTDEGLLQEQGYALIPIRMKAA